MNNICNMELTPDNIQKQLRIEITQKLPDRILASYVNAVKKYHDNVDGKNIVEVWKEELDVLTEDLSGEVLALLQLHTSETIYAKKQKNERKRKRVNSVILKSESVPRMSEEISI